jgi:hypothetical protein
MEQPYMLEIRLPHHQKCHCSVVMIAVVLEE